MRGRGRVAAIRSREWPGRWFQREIPAVIAMQFEISDEAAIVFAEGFYSSLANGSPVDAAVAAARLAMFARRNDDIEWGTPALYMRVPDGRIFDLPDSRTQVSAPADQRLIEPDEPGTHSSTPVTAAAGAVGGARRGEPNASDKVSSTSESWRTRYRRALLAAGLVVALALGGGVAEVLGSSSSGSSSALGSESSVNATDHIYTVAVNELCRLDNAQHRAQPASIRAFKLELARARTWQQRQEDVLQLVDADITDGNNLLVDLEALQPPTAVAAGWQHVATHGLNVSLAALNTYALSLQNVRGEGQLAARVAAFDDNGQRFAATGDTVRVALKRIGGPNCLTPIPKVPFAPLFPNNGAEPGVPVYTAPPQASPPAITTPLVSAAPLPAPMTSPPSSAPPNAVPPVTSTTPPK